MFSMEPVIADECGRVKVAEPGDRFDLSKDAQGRIILRKLQPNSPISDDTPVLGLGLNGELIWPKGTRKPSAAEIAIAVREERDSE
jgi:hypothetical protein